MTGGTITGLLSPFGLLTLLDGSEPPVFCLYRVVDDVETLIYTGEGPTFTYPNPDPYVEQIYRLYVCGDPCGPSDYDEVTIPAEEVPPDVFPPAVVDSPWERNCEPGQTTAWTTNCAPGAASSWTKEN